MTANTEMTVCPFCSSSEVSEHPHDEVVSIGRRKITVPGIVFTECSNCGEEFTTAIQYQRNLDRKKSFTESVQGFFLPGLVRKLREKYGLSQRIASKLFGAGPSSVAKWESGLAPSGPAALLIQCSVHVPGVVDYLASLAKVELGDAREEITWMRSEPVPYLRVVSKRPILFAAHIKTNQYFVASEDYSFDEINGMAA